MRVDHDCLDSCKEYQQTSLWGTLPKAHPGQTVFMTYTEFGRLIRGCYSGPTLGTAMVTCIVLVSKTCRMWTWSSSWFGQQIQGGPSIDNSVAKAVLKMDANDGLIECTWAVFFMNLGRHTPGPTDLLLWSPVRFLLMVLVLMSSFVSRMPSWLVCSPSSHVRIRYGRRVF